MPEPLFFSRARLRQDVPAAALHQLLLPGSHGQRAGAGHRLIWILFADSPDRTRDFLWREGDAGVFYTLSRRPPVDQHGLFVLDPPKEFAPRLVAGDRLAFSLRANATVAKASVPGKRGKPSDVVMAAIKEVPSGARASARADAVRDAGYRWLDAQGRRAGFAIVRRTDGGAAEAAPLLRTSYRTMRVDHAGPRATLGVLDFDGVLEVTNPELLLDGISRGFGRAKAFGCGLMLVRRVE